MRMNFLGTLASAFLLTAAFGLRADSSVDPNTPKDFLEKNYTKIAPDAMPGNAIKMFGQEWSIVSAGNDAKFNGLTVAWGGFGVWDKPVAYVIIRDSRHTYPFLEKESHFTISFFEEKYKPALMVFGTKSGKDIDKAKEAKLTPISTAPGVAFGEAKLIVVCKKIYAEMTKGECKFPPIPDQQHHKVFYGEIVSVWQKK